MGGRLDGFYHSSQHLVWYRAIVLLYLIGWLSLSMSKESDYFIYFQVICIPFWSWFVKKYQKLWAQNFMTETPQLLFSVVRSFCLHCSLDRAPVPLHRQPPGGATQVQAGMVQCDALRGRVCRHQPRQCRILNVSGLVHLLFSCPILWYGGETKG